MPGETEWHSVTQQQCSSETAKNNTVELRKHEFPLCSLGKTGTVRVFVEAQRYAETPTITCACQSAAQTSSKSDQKSAVPLPRLSESSIGSTETDEESILDGFLPDSSNTLKVVDRRRQR